MQNVIGDLSGRRVPEKLKMDTGSSQNCDFQTAVLFDSPEVGFVVGVKFITIFPGDGGVQAVVAILEANLTG